MNLTHLIMFQFWTGASAAESAAEVPNVSVAVSSPMSVAVSESSPMSVVVTLANVE